VQISDNLLHRASCPIVNTYLGHAAGSIKQAITDAWRRYATYRRG